MTAHRIDAPEILDQEGGRQLVRAASEAGMGKGQELVLDLSRTKRMDSQGAAWLVETAGLARACGATFRWEGQAGQTAEFMALVEPSIAAEGAAPPRKAGLLESFGGLAYDSAREFRDFLDLCADAVYWTFIAPLEGKGFRWGLLVDEIHEMGVRAIRIVVLMNFLLGLIIAMLSSKQAEVYGISIFVADAIMIGFARELAAIMTAVVVSARTGAAIAAEISTMKVQEEIDALRGMGVSVAQYLVAPKLLALVIVLPCLAALGLVAGIAGGAIWGMYVLDFSASVWLHQTREAAAIGDLFQGFFKSIFFAIAIALIGCHNGLRVTGGSRGVGLMTTRAVVMDIFMLIVIDICFAAMFYYVLD